VIGLGRHRGVDRHFFGDSGPGASRRLFRHLARCSRCREAYRIYASLEALETNGDARARERLGRAIFPSRRPRLAWRAGGAVGLAAACAAFVLWVVRPPEPFRARGSGAGLPAVAAAARTPALAVYRVQQEGGARRAGHVVSAGEALAFTYSNAPADPYRYLMVFGRDAAGRVFWFWPTWQNSADDPSSLPIRASTEPVELGDSVRHSLTGGPLTIVGLFSQQAHRVREVEAALAGGVGGLAGLEGRVWTETFEVSP
jgi:hypothetical protein